MFGIRVIVTEWPNDKGWKRVRMCSGPWWYLWWMQRVRGGTLFQNSWLPPLVCFDAAGTGEKG